ncbi:MAG: MraY family glycosyltransferase [Acidimicrobiia bacterium]|jgi:UDP-GlcNAc:undecaprenyl-phosphate GlcNAc-1-phosphate transferase
MATALGVATGFAVSAFLSWLAVLAGTRLGVIDLPDGQLKTHTGSPVPLGGAALMGAIHTGLLVSGGFDPGLLLATTLVFVMGLVDDIRGLSPRVRLAGAVLAAISLVVTSSVADGLISGLAGVALVVIAMNAVNLFDGLDGLASSVTAVGFGALGLLGFVVGIADPWLPLVMTGALAGVLLFNWPPARLYLGDNGAYVVGMALAWAVLHSASDWGEGLVAAALIGVPLIDLAVTVARRLRERRPLFTGDRDHTYDRLNRRLSTTSGVVVTMALLQLSWAGSVLLVVAIWGTAIAVTFAVAAGLALVGAGWVSR